MILFASNYTPNNLGRLFGYPSHFDTDISGDPRTDELSAIEKIASEKTPAFKMQAAKIFDIDFSSGEYTGGIFLKPGTAVKIAAPGFPAGCSPW